MGAVVAGSAVGLVTFGLVVVGLAVGRLVVFGGGVRLVVVVRLVV